MTVAAPTAAFSADQTTGECPIVVVFTDESTGSPDSRWRDFGDGNFSNLQNPVHTYYFKGLKTVSLYINNDAGEDTELKIDYLDFDETTAGQENIDHETEGRRGGRSFPPVTDEVTPIENNTIVEGRDGDENIYPFQA